MTTTRRTNSKSFPDPSPTPALPAASPHDTSADVEVIEVYLPAPPSAYPVVPFEHTIGAHANAVASAHLLADHIQGLSVSSRQLGIILKKWWGFSAPPMCFALTPPRGALSRGGSCRRTLNFC